MASCSTNCLKIILVICNVLFWLFGLGLLAIGVWLQVDQRISNVGEALKIGLDESVIEIASWVFIGAGIWAFLVGFFGCCGAIKESQCLLGFYLVCLFFAFSAEVAIAIYTGIQYDQIVDSIRSSGKDWVQTEYNGTTLVSKGFNYVQMEFCCCGVNDYRDYKDSDYLMNNNQIKPGAYMVFACCKAAPDTDNDGVRNIDAKDKDMCMDQAIALGQNLSEPGQSDCDSAFRPEGCVDKIEEWVDENLPIFFGVAAGVAFVQILIFAISVCLCVRIRREGGEKSA